MPGSATVAGALDRLVVVLFENRSVVSVLGHVYGPGDCRTFDAWHYFPRLSPDTAKVAG
jgi:hypothetical protein